MEIGNTNFRERFNLQKLYFYHPPLLYKNLEKPNKKWLIWAIDCLPTRSVLSWIALYHLLEVRRGRTLTFTYWWQFNCLAEEDVHRRPWQHYYNNISKLKYWFTDFYKKWWIWPGSNRLPPRCERGALPDELQTHNAIIK